MQQMSNKVCFERENLIYGECCKRNAKGVALLCSGSLMQGDTPSVQDNVLS